MLRYGLASRRSAIGVHAAHGGEVVLGDRLRLRAAVLVAGERFDDARRLGVHVGVEYLPVAVDGLADDELAPVANRVNYGLTSSILTSDTFRGFELAQRIEHGIVNVNSPTVNDEMHAPMGGVKDSGWGRTGPDSIADFSDVIWINARSGQREYPF